MTCKITDLGCVDEQSSAQINITFDDSAGTLHTPSAAKWTLSDEDGNVVNSRDGVAISPLGTTVTITLEGSDLALPVPLMPTRYISVFATISGRPWRKEFSVTIRNHRRTVT